MLIDGRQKFCSVPGRPAILRLQHHVALPGDYPGQRVQPKLIVGLRATMRKHQKRILLSFHVTHRKGRDTFERDPILALPPHHTRRPQLHCGQLPICFGRDLPQMVPVRHSHVCGMVWIFDGQRDLIARVRIHAPRWHTLDRPFLPAIDRHQRPITKLFDIVLHAMRHRYPHPPLGVAFQFDRRPLQIRRPVRSASTRRGHRPHMLRRQRLGLCREKCKLLSAIGPRDPAHRVGNVGHMLRALRAAKINRRRHLVMSDVRHRREHRQR